MAAAQAIAQAVATSMPGQCSDAFTAFVNAALAELARGRPFVYGNWAMTNPTLAAQLCSADCLQSLRAQFSQLYPAPTPCQAEAIQNILQTLQQCAPGRALRGR
jgi:hypothetical protein